MAALDMLRSRLDFGALQTNGRSRTDQLLVLRYRRNGLDRTRYGISTGRRVGGAVARNRIRRRLRHILAALEREIAAGWDVLLIARPPAASAAYGDLQAAVGRLVRGAGLTRGEVSDR